MTALMDGGAWTGADGVVSIRFTLSHAQLEATGSAAGVACRERYRDDDLTVDDVLAMRQLLSVADHLAGLAATGLGAAVELSVAALAQLHDALIAWIEAREQRGWMRDDERDLHRVLHPLVLELDALRADAVRAALADDAAALCAH